MTIKLIIFDLDGVLVDSRDIHYYSLNDALKDIDEKYIITREEHLSTYDGLSTSKKLELLTNNKNLDKKHYNFIWERKQKYTVNYINKMEHDINIIDILQKLKNEGYLIYVASNAIYNTIKQTLVKKGFIDYIDYFISNQDITHPKPHPEIYLKCIIRSGFIPKECLIIEDSNIGRQAAINSGCNVMAVENYNTYSYEDIQKCIKSYNSVENIRIPWNGKLNILIPMAGLGSRFQKVGYKDPKPLIDVNGKPMIQRVVENINCSYDTCRFIFICQKSHYEEYHLKYLLNLIAPNCVIIQVDGLTEGAACTSLLAKDYINNDEHLLFANSDQILEWDVNQFLYTMMNDKVDGGISVFKDNATKWSYAKLDDNGFVCEVAEKKVISNLATTGIYYYKHGKDFVKYAEKMIEKNIRVNNEFYVCPVFNELIEVGKKIKTHNVEKMWGIGTPEDLEYYLNYAKNIV